MVNFRLATVILIGCNGVSNAFHSNTITKRQRRIQIEANSRERDVIEDRASRFKQYVSYSVDGSNFVPAEDGSTSGQSWVDATKKSILKDIDEEQKAEDAAVNNCYYEDWISKKDRTWLNCH
jgi:hypothetical protein